MNSISQQPFHVLALSGGGIRGLHAARILEMLEAHFGAPVAQRFDLICGTSVGGILAIGLALERPASSLRELLEKRGPEVFGRSLKRRLLPLLYAKHSDEGMRRELEALFGEATLGNLLHPVVIPAVDASAGVAVMFKTPHHPELKVDHTRSLVHVALATTAAPTYFPIFRSPDSRLFVDGGLVANAPGLCGLHEAEVFFNQAPRNVRILSIGTASVGRNVRSRKRNRGLDLGILGWGSRVFDLTVSAQESLVHSLLRHRCKDSYVLIDSKVDTERSRDIRRLDQATRPAVETLLAAAAKAGQEFLGTGGFAEFSNHRPTAHPFYYGPHARSPGDPHARHESASALHR